MNMFAVDVCVGVASVLCANIPIKCSAHRSLVRLMSRGSRHSFYLGQTLQLFRLSIQLFASFGARMIPLCVHPGAAAAAAAPPLPPSTAPSSACQHDLQHVPSTDGECLGPGETLLHGSGACLHVMAHETGCMPAAAFCVNTGTGTVSADGGSAMTASSPGQLMLSAYCIPPRRE